MINPLAFLYDLFETAYEFVEDSFDNGWLFIGLIALFVIFIWILLSIF